MKYTVSIATFYGGKWHIDRTSESAPMSEQEAIEAGRIIAALGTFMLYTEYINGIAGRIMIDDGHGLKPAFVEMIA